MSELDHDIPKEVLLDQIAGNLRPYSEIIKLADHSKSVLEHMQQTGFKFLIKDLNNMFGDGLFTAEDFTAAMINPDNVDPIQYQRFYGMLPITPSIGIDDQQWFEFTANVGGSTHYRLLPGSDFESDTFDKKTDFYDLKRFGLHLYVRQEDEVLRQCNTLRMDSWNYANHKTEVERYEEGSNRAYNRSWVEHRLIGDICFNLAQEDVGKKDCIGLLDRVNSKYFDQIWKRYCKSSHSEEDERIFELQCESDEETIKVKIFKAVSAVEHLESVLDPRDIALILYSMGGKSPLNSIVALSHRVKERSIYRDDITDRLRVKGYGRPMTHSVNF